jgi:flagellar hook-basal body complex protein FliE
MSALRSLVSSTTAKAIRPSSLLAPSSQRLTAHPTGRHIRAPLITARHESQSAFSKFVETLKEQIKKNKELQESVKKLQDESGKAGDSDALKKAKDAFEKAKVHCSFCICILFLFPLLSLLSLLFCGPSHNLFFFFFLLVGHVGMSKYDDFTTFVTNEPCFSLSIFLHFFRSPRR